MDATPTRDGRPLLTVAHRAGNDTAALRRALDAGVDLVEADVHRYRRMVEIRHSKRLGPHLLWERWELSRRRDVIVPELTEILHALGADPRLMLDLKGVHPGLAPAVAAELRATVPGLTVTVCTRRWWMLRAFDGDGRIRRVLSAGNRLELRRLLSRVRTARAFGVSVRRDLLTAAAVDELHASVEYVLTWPVDTPADLDDARRLGVGGIIGNDLSLLDRVHKER